MPHMYRGTATEIFRSFGCDFLLQKNSEHVSYSYKDYYRSQFLGSREQFDTFIENLKGNAKEHDKFYAQGDLTGGNLNFVLNPSNCSEPFIQEKDKANIEKYRAQRAQIYFAYVDDYNQLCALSITYREDDPSLWMIGLVKNTNLPPDDKTLILFSSQDIAADKALSRGIKKTVENVTKNSLIDEVHSPFVKEVVEHLLLEDRERITLKAKRLNLIVQKTAALKDLSVECPDLSKFKAKDLFADNPVLDLLTKYDIRISPSQLSECFDLETGLGRAIRQLNIEVTPENQNRNENLLNLVVGLHANKLLDDFKIEGLEHQVQLLEKRNVLIDSAYEMAGELDPAQISLFPFLIQEQFNLQQIKLIFSKKSYYDTAYQLKQIGCLHHMPNLLTPVNLNKLEFISELKSDLSKKICLFFVAKGEFDRISLAEIVASIRTNPLALNTLLHLQKNQEFSINQLKEKILDPKEFLRTSIFLNYSQLFAKYKLKQNQLDTLSDAELNLLIPTLHTLEEAEITDPKVYHAALANDQSGQLIRLILSKMPATYPDDLKTLVEIMVKGVDHLDEQVQAIADIDDKALKTMALVLHRSFVKIKQSQCLGFNDAKLNLAAHPIFMKQVEFLKYPAVAFLRQQCMSVDASDMQRFLLEECLDPATEFSEEIESIAFTDNFDVNLQLLEIAALCFIENVLPKQRELCNYIFTLIKKELFNDRQLVVAPILLKRGYDADLIKQILSNKALYNAILFLKDFQNNIGLLQNIPDFLKNETKLKQLEVIDALPLDNQKHICLLLWATSDDFTDEQLGLLIKATEQNKLLADSLLAQDVSQHRKLLKLALNPKENRKRAILHNYAEEFNTHALPKSELNHAELDLNEVMDSFDLLKAAKIDDGAIYKQVLKHDDLGKLFRLFLQECAQAPQEFQQQLIKTIHLGIKNSTNSLVVQEQAIKEFKNKDLIVLAEEMQKRFVSALLLINNNFKYECVLFAASKRPRANDYREILFEIEQQGKKIQERLRQSSSSTNQSGLWADAYNRYKDNMCGFAYVALTNPGSVNIIELTAEIKREEDLLLAIVDPQDHGWLKQALIVIANILITTLTLGIANGVKYGCTGNFWFFNQTKSGEEIRAQDSSVLERITYQHVH